MSIPKSSPTDPSQAELQARHGFGGELLPKDLRIDGRNFNVRFRSHPKGGRVVLARDSLPGRVDGHGALLVYEITVDALTGRELLGQCIATCASMDFAITIASRQ